MLLFGIWPAKCYIQECTTYIFIPHVAFDVDYAQYYDIKHSASVLLYCFNLTGMVTFGQSGHNKSLRKPLFITQ